MKTDELIGALAADTQREMGLRRRLGLGLAAGALVSLVVFWFSLGVRADFVSALANWRFDAKVVLMTAAMAVAFGLSLQASAPVEGRRHAIVWLLPVAVGLAVAFELASLPSSSWKANLIGTNAKVCLMAIPALSLAPLALGLFALRGGAAASPTRAGAFLGFLAWATGATLYAFHCFDDSPLFVATWYLLAALPVIALGALLGRRLLRW